MIKKSLGRAAKSITNQAGLLAHSFSTETMNFRVPLVDPFTQKITDQYVMQYRNQMFSAYLYKRKVTRAEIWPKIYIIDKVPNQEEHHLSYQSLFNLKKTLDEDVIKKIAEEDPSQINSAYIISMFGEDYFKEMMDEYVKKVLVCGKAPSSEAMRQLEHKVLDWYRVFYFGEKISPLERQIESFYLIVKQEKSIKKQLMPKNAYLRCTWRNQDQRLLQNYANWLDVDINLSDLNYRPYFERLTLTQRLPYVQKFNQLIGGDTFLQRMEFNFSVKKSYTYSMSYFSWITQKLFTRTIIYTRSLEFTHLMKIPPDFMIEICILNIHIWLIVNRLRSFQTKASKNIIAGLEQIFNRHIDESLGNLNLKKMSVAKRTFHEMVDISTNALNMHFTFYETTKQNPYLHIDALVWSIAFRERVERYGPEVYLFSEYLVKNWEHSFQFSEKDFIDGVCEFDPYLIDPDYEAKIKAINPPMLPQQFQKQFRSDKNEKAYYYRVLEGSKKPFTFEDDEKGENLEYSLLRNVISKTLRFVKKYMTNLEKYDHFSEMDEQKKKIQKDNATSPWKSEKDRMTQIDQEFQEVNQIRRDRKDTENKQQK